MLILSELVDSAVVRFNEAQSSSVVVKAWHVCRHHGRNDYLFFADKWWFIGAEVGKTAGSLLVRDAAWRPEHVRARWEVFVNAHFELDSGLRVRCQGLPFRSSAREAEYNRNSNNIININCI